MRLTVAEIKQTLAEADACHRDHEERKAISLYESVLPYQADNATIYAAIGECYVNKRYADEAIANLKQALALDPALIQCHLRLADAYNIKGNRVKALGYLSKCQSAIKGTPYEGYWWLTRADALKMARDYERAGDAYKHAHDLLGDIPEFFSSYGPYLMLIDRPDEATDCYERAFVGRPSWMYGQQLGMHYLTVGQWERGWRLYEYRLHEKLPRGFSVKPAVNANEHIDGALTIHQEGGLGDLTQMARYIPLFKKCADKVYLVVQPDLLELAKRFKLPGITVVDDEHIPEHIAELPLLSLPFRCGVYAPKDGPKPIKFKRIPKPKKDYVIFNWFGNTAFIHDDLRSAKLSDFAPLIRAMDLDWVTINVGGRIQKELAANNLEGRIRHWPGKFEDVVDKIAQAKAMVTTDTGLAHVAGTLGIPTFMVLRSYPEWRWGLTGDRTAWYPSIKMYRWKSGDISPILKQIQTELEILDGKTHKSRAQEHEEIGVRAACQA